MDTRPKKKQKRRVVTTPADEDENQSILVETGRTATSHTRPHGSSTISDDNNRKIQLGLPTTSQWKKSGLVPKSSATVTTSALKKSSGTGDGAGSKAKLPNSAASRPISTFFISKLVSHRDGHDRVLQSGQDTEDIRSKQLEQEQEDAIEEESCTERTDFQNSTRRILDRRKQNGTVVGVGKKSVNLGQTFKISSRGSHQGCSKRNCPTIEETNGRSWAERYGPLTLEELAVNKKKVANVKTWLDRIWYGDESQQLLVLKGPSGAGKTTTIEALARDMDFDILEWRNPVGSEVSSEGYSSMSAQFDDFLSCSGRFGKLDLVGDTTISTLERKSHPNLGQHPNKKRIILLEEFPNISVVTSNILRSFRSSIIRFLMTSTLSQGAYLSEPKKSNNSIIPLIMVITETRSNSSIAAGETFTAHKLLGPEVLNHSRVGIIEFNPVATTFLTKALDLVLHKEAGDSGRRRIPSAPMLKKLGELGDMRSAIGSLEFLCVRKKDEDDWGDQVAAGGRNADQFPMSLTSMEQKSLEMVTQRETSVGLFHAVGKVVYNKREGTKTGSDLNCNMTQPPDHLSEHVRRRLSQVDVDQLANEICCDSSTFVAALHENYVISCEGASFIGSLNGCIEALSDADLFHSAGGGRSSGAGGGYSGLASLGKATESLRADDISFQLAARALLFSLPDPVKRTSHPLGIAGRIGGKADAHKMYYPTSARMLRQREEYSDTIDQWVIRLQGTNKITSSEADVVPQGLLHDGEETVLISSNEDSQAKEVKPNESLRTNLGVTRDELTAERLPYLCKMGTRSLAPGHLRELENITQFRGIYFAGADLNEELDEDLAGGIQVDAVNVTTSGRGSLHATAPTTEVAKPTPAGNNESIEGSNYIMVAKEKIEKLYLTDDDIEDDEL